MNGLPRRALLRGGMVSVAAAGLGSAAPALAAAPAYAGRIMSLPDRAALAALEPVEAGRLVHLDEPGREGLFRCMAGSAPADDPLQGLSVPARARGLVWQRVWDGTHGRAEWFGARVNDPAADCADALEACHRLCPVTDLLQADYFVRRTVRLDRSWRTMRGSGRYATNQGQGTRIILQQAARGVRTDDIVLLGKTGGGDLVTESHLYDLTIVRDGPSQPHASGDLARYPTGLRCLHLSHCTVAGVASLESSVGFYIGGVVYTKVDDCLAQRTRAGEGAGQDRAAGFFLDGRVRFGFPGGNASLYMDRCATAEQHRNHVEPAGLVAQGAFVDSFIDRFESARVDTGMRFFADGARGWGQTIDLHVRSPVLDGCRRGIDLALDGTATASIDISDPYVAAVGSGGVSAIAVRDGAGLVTITGGQLLGEFAQGSLAISRTRGVTVQGLKIHHCSRPVVATQARGLDLAPQISNIDRPTGGPAVELSNVTRSAIRPTLTGHPQPAFSSGVSLDAATSFCAIDGSAIDPACLAGADPRAKVLFRGGDARSGATGQAFAAAGNRLIGVVD